MRAIGRRKVSRHGNGKGTTQFLVHLPAEIVEQWKDVTHVEFGWGPGHKHVVMKPVSRKEEA